MEENNEISLLKKSVNECTEKIVELQTLLTSIPAIAPESGGDGELKKCLALEEYLKKLGFTQFERYDAKDDRVTDKVRPNLVVTVPGKFYGTEKDSAVYVMAHLDVVPPGEEKLWNSSPWEVVYDEKEGKLTGRGVEDNQQGLVSGVFAAYSLIKNQIVPERTVKLLFMADEECGSEYGIKFLLEKHKDIFSKNDLILIPDGGDRLGETIEIAEKNILWLKITVKGEQTHGSTPDKGKNACLAGCRLALELNWMERIFNKKDSLFEPPYSTFQPTKKEANVQTVNIIPGEDVFYMDCRILPCYTLDEIRSEIKTRCRALEISSGVKVIVEELQAEQSPQTSEKSDVVKILSEAIKSAHGKKPRLIGIGGGTVGAHLRVNGFYTAIWSTIEGVCHQPNEFSLIENTIKDCETLIHVFMTKIGQTE